MSTLKDYLESFPIEGRAREKVRIADTCGVTPGAVTHWANGTRAVPAKRCRDLEQATDGRVTRYEQRPDVFGNSIASVGHQTPAGAAA
ncbi:MAG: YdaS family helix-turn-helix protein [Algiphilus sp.]|uniref:transcriptional regulator n=1 Tax=Algiphilus sp. TaxID=1872431 RepID=UPI0032EFE4D5